MGVESATRLEGVVEERRTEKEGQKEYRQEGETEKQ